MNTVIEPVGKKLLVKKLQFKEIKRESGIDIPETGVGLSEGEVIAVSKEITHIFTKGSIILFPSKKGMAEPRMGMDYLWLDATDTKEEIWGVIKR